MRIPQSAIEPFGVLGIPRERKLSRNAILRMQRLIRERANNLTKYLNTGKEKISGCEELSRWYKQMIISCGGDPIHVHTTTDASFWIVTAVYKIPGTRVTERIHAYINMI